MIFAPANPKYGPESAQAYEIQVERKDVSAEKFLLEAVYAITPEAQTAHTIVPYSLKHESQDIYRSVLRTQNSYLFEHRNIPLAGITIRQMHELVMWNQIEQTPHEVLSALKGVSRVDPTTRTYDLGKFNLSCTKDTYVDIVKWLDSKATSLFDDTTEDQILADTPIPNPVRMSRGPARRCNNANKSAPSAYTQHLRTKYPTTVGTPPPPAPNAWKNTSRQASNFNYSVEHFPNLIPPNQPPAVSVAPSASTQPLSQTSTMTDAETQAFIATCVSTEYAKLVHTTTQLSTDISTMRKEFHDMIETTRTEQTAQMKNLFPTPSATPLLI
jgi:hypothetical protein